MLRSMTGFGRGDDTIGGRHIVFEIKSVNHKYFEFNSRIPRGYLFLEDKLKAYIQGKISRGKVDVFLQIETLEETDVQVLVNHSLASAYVTALQELKERYQLPDEPSLALLSKYSDIFSVHKAPEDEDAVWEAVRQVADQAIASFLKMREAEGARLKADILEKAGEIVALVDQVERHTPETVEHYRERLKAKIEELLQDNRFDEQRVLTEVAIFADKVAVDEETVRLRSHFQQLQRLVDSDGPVGRKIDFLVQEMNREANTIGSKSVNSQIAYLVVDIKALIEKIREQVQNVE
ncbi:MAG: YicC/YloC family endoribonuclease [Acutalibacter sp.]